MKKAVFDIAKTSVLLICVYITGNSVLAQTVSGASLCPEPPTYIQIHHQFDWSPAEQKRLMRDFELKCGLPEDVDWLIRRTETTLKAQGIRVTKTKLSMETEFKQAIFLGSVRLVAFPTLSMIFMNFSR